MVNITHFFFNSIKILCAGKHFNPELTIDGEMNVD